MTSKDEGLDATAEGSETPSINDLCIRLGFIANEPKKVIPEEIEWACDRAIQELRRMSRALAAQPAREPLQWLASHCRAIGMSKKSDSGKIEDDIALFTIIQKDEIARLAAALAAQPAREDRAAIIEECAKVADRQAIHAAFGELGRLSGAAMAKETSEIIAKDIRALAQGKP